MATNIITARFGSKLSTRTASKYQYDYGQVLKFADLDLPEVYEVHFSNREFFGTAIKQLGNADGVTIPDELFWSDTARAIYAWVYLHHTDDDGETVYKVTIPLALRSRPSDVEPTPVQQDVIEQAIAALNGAVDATAASAAEAAESATEAETARQAAEAAVETAEAARTAAEGAQAAAEQSAGAAASSAEAAGRSATDAETAAGQAEDAAGRAETAAQTVESRVADAETAATQAAGSATTASGAASQAAQKAGEASTYANNAEQSAIAASGSAIAAADSANAASESATAAERYEDGAVGAATMAASSADAAHTSEANAASSATAAAASAEAAAKSAEDAETAVQTIKTTTAAIIIDSASGAVVSVPDGADDLPMQSVKVSIEPVQDLHGQDAPYPPGGGKNKLPYPYAIGSGRTVNGVTATVSSDGIVTLNGTATAQAEFPLIATYIDLPAGTYTLGGLPSGGSATTFVYNAYAFDENDTILFDYRITSSRTVTVNNPIKRMYMYIRVAEGYTANNLVVKPQFEEGSAATDYAPYSNICPISGWDEVVTHRTGVNVWDEEWENGRFNINTGEKAYGNGIRSKNMVFVKPSTTYFALRGAYTGAASIILLYYDANKGYISYENKAGISASFTTPSDCYFININIQTSAEVTTYNHDVSINYPSTDHDYHPYHGSTYTTDLPATVYGGTLDVVTGELTVDRAMVDLGTLEWTKHATNNVFYAPFSGNPDRTGGNFGYNYISSVFVYGANATAMWNGSETGLVVEPEAISSTPRIYARAYAYDAMTATEFKTAMDGVQLVYELATPTIYQLTPQEVKTLLGSNNVWSDAGNVEITYPCDTKLYILKVVGA